MFFLLHPEFVWPLLPLNTYKCIHMHAGMYTPHTLCCTIVPFLKCYPLQAPQTVRGGSWLSYPAFSFGCVCEDVNGEGWGWCEAPVIMQAIANCGPLTL